MITQQLCPVVLLDHSPSPSAYLDGILEVMAMKERKHAFVSNGNASSRMAPRKRQAINRASSKTGARTRGSGEDAPVDYDIHFTDQWQRERYESIKKKKFVQSACLDWEVAIKEKVADHIRPFVEVGSWDRLLSIREEVCREVTLEFLSTFKLKKDHYTFGIDNEMVFSIQGLPYKVTISQFAHFMGLYDSEFIASLAFMALPYEQPSVTEYGVYWLELTGRDDYNPGLSKASQLRNPALRLIHWILARSVTGRGESHGVVRMGDLYFLYNMHRRRPLNLALVLVFALRHQVQDNRGDKIFAGPYVTRLLKGMGLWDKLPRMTLENGTKPWTTYNIKRCGGEDLVGVQLSEIGGTSGSASTSPIRNFMPNTPFERFVAYSLGIMKNKIDHLSTHMQRFMAEHDYHMPLTPEMPAGFAHYVEENVSVEEPKDEDDEYEQIDRYRAKLDQGREKEHRENGGQFSDADDDGDDG